MRKEKNVPCPGKNSNSTAYILLPKDKKKTCIDDKEGYYFDRIHINFMWDTDELNDKFSIDILKKECRSFALRPSSPYLSGYKTRMEVVAPTRRFLEHLVKDISISDKHYIVTYIEIAHDVFYPTERKAEYESYSLFSTIRKRYSRGYIYDEDKTARRMSAKQWQKRYYERGLFATKTFYSVYENTKAGTRRSWFKLVIYARLSKINWKPCVHYEWRIKKAAQINKRTGIRTIHDLLNFDFKRLFLEMEKKYVVHEELNTKKIGRVLSGLERRRTLTNRHLLHVDLAFATFRSHYEIISVSDFANAINQERQHLDRIRGPRTLWARKIRKLSNFTSYSRAL